MNINWGMHVKPFNRLLTAVFSAGLLAAATGAASANIVVNGGFETGDLSGYDASSCGCDVTNSSAFVHSGNYGLSFFGAGHDYLLSQTLATSSGTTYTIDFFAKFLGGSPNDISVTFGGVQVLDLVNQATSSVWQEYSVTGMATSSSTVLTFGLRQDPSASALDDISVNAITTATPEPSSWAMMILGFAGIGAMTYRRRKSAMLTA
jgi:Carbohydrate binding domain/PEP-CTERM motif